MKNRDSQSDDDRPEGQVGGQQVIIVKPRRIWPWVIGIPMVIFMLFFGGCYKMVEALGGELGKVKPPSTAQSDSQTGNATGGSEHRTDRLLQSSVPEEGPVTVTYTVLRKDSSVIPDEEDPNAKPGAWLDYPKFNMEYAYIDGSGVNRQGTTAYHYFSETVNFQGGIPDSGIGVRVQSGTGPHRFECEIAMNGQVIVSRKSRVVANTPFECSAVPS